MKNAHLIALCRRYYVSFRHCGFCRTREDRTAFHGYRVLQDSNMVVVLRRWCLSDHRVPGKRRLVGCRTKNSVETLPSVTSSASLDIMISECSYGPDSDKIA